MLVQQYLTIKAGPGGFGIQFGIEELLLQLFDYIVSFLILPLVVVNLSQLVDFELTIVNNFKISIILVRLGV